MVEVTVAKNLFHVEQSDLANRLFETFAPGLHGIFGAERVADIASEAPERSEFGELST